MPMGTIRAPQSTAYVLIALQVLHRPSNPANVICIEPHHDSVPATAQALGAICAASRTLTQDDAISTMQQNCSAEQHMVPGRFHPCSAAQKVHACATQLRLCLCVMAHAGHAGGLHAPVAKALPQQIKGRWGAAREDDYAWLRDDSRTNPEVLNHLIEVSGAPEEHTAPAHSTMLGVPCMATQAHAQAAGLAVALDMCFPSPGDGVHEILGASTLGLLCSAMCCEVPGQQATFKLRQENKFTEAVLGTGLADTIEEEMRQRVPPDDQSVPQRLDGYWYYSYRKAGRQYRVHCRSVPHPPRRRLMLTRRRERRPRGAACWCRQLARTC